MRGVRQRRRHACVCVCARIACVFILCVCVAAQMLAQETAPNMCTNMRHNEVTVSGAVNLIAQNVCEQCVTGQTRHWLVGVFTSFCVITKSMHAHWLTHTHTHTNRKAHTVFECVLCTVVARTATGCTHTRVRKVLTIYNEASVWVHVSESPHTLEQKQHARSAWRQTLASCSRSWLFRVLVCVCECPVYLERCACAWTARCSARNRLSH